MKDAPYTLIYGIIYKKGPNDVLSKCGLKHERE